MIKLPHRNIMKKNSNLDFDLNKQYINNIFIKPRGIWYQIDNCLFEWDVLGFGNFCFDIKIKTNILNKEQGILSIKTIEEFHLFNNKYKVIRKDNFVYINWEKVSKDFGGFEIKNYNFINEELRKDKNYINKYTWFNTFDFSSGCIWNLKLIKNISFFKELTDEDFGI